MPNVQAPDGTVVNFPDTMAAADIAGVMRQHFPPGGAGHASPSYWDDLKGGAHDLGTSVSQGASAVGGVMARNNIPGGESVQNAGNYVAAHTPDAPAGPSPTEGMTNAIRNGDIGGALSAAPHAALRAAVGAAPVLAAGALTGPVGAGVAAGLQGLGPLAFNRAQNNLRSQPNTADVVGAIPGAVGEGVGGALLPGASKALSPLARAGVNVAKDAAGGAIMDTAGQLGGSVGTTQGAQFDPSQTAASAATMGTMGAARSVPAIGRATVGGLSDNIMSRTAVDQPSSPGQAASQARVGQLYQDAQARNPNNNPLQTLNSLKTEVSQKTLALMREAAQVGLLPADTLAMGKKVLIDQALRHNNSIDSGDDGGTSTLYDEVANSGVHPDVLQPILQGIQDTNTLSPSSFLKNQTGPFRTIGNGIGAVGDIASHLGIGGHPISRLAGAAGGIVDNVMGTATPKVLLQAIAARRALAGADPGPNTLQSIADARANVANAPPPPAPPGPTPPFIKPLGQGNVMNPPPQVNPVTGNAPDPVPVNTPIPPGTRPTAPPAPTGGAGLPPLAVDTPASVRAALEQADMMMGKPPGTPAAAPQARPTASQYVGAPIGATHGEVLQAAAGTPHADLVAGNLGMSMPFLDKAAAQQLQAKILTGRAQQAGQAAIRNPIAYAKAAQNYMTMSENVAQQLAGAGMTDAAAAVRNIAHNHHSIAGKQAARAALPPAVAKLIPDAIVNHGGP